jgi:hypothetical protein
MALSLQVDAASSATGQTALLVTAYAGVATIAVTEGAAAGATSLTTPDAGTLSGLTTVARYLASLSASSAQLLGATPEDEAAIAEWLTRAGVEYSGGAIGEDKLALLNTHLLTRSTLCGDGAATVSLADLILVGLYSC